MMWRRTARGDGFDVQLSRGGQRPALVAGTTTTLVNKSEGSDSATGPGQAAQEKQAWVEVQVGSGDAEGH